VGILTLVHFNGSGRAADVGAGLRIMRLKNRQIKIVMDNTGHANLTLCAFDTWRILLLINVIVNSGIGKYHC
jgi:hypothetical protein